MPVMIQLIVMMHAKLFLKLTSSYGKKQSTSYAKLTINKSDAKRPLISRKTLRNPVALITTQVMKKRERLLIS